MFSLVYEDMFIFLKLPLEAEISSSKAGDIKKARLAFLNVTVFIPAREPDYCRGLITQTSPSEC